MLIKATEWNANHASSTTQFKEHLSNKPTWGM